MINSLKIYLTIRPFSNRKAIYVLALFGVILGGFFLASGKMDGALYFNPGLVYSSYFLFTAQISDLIFNGRETDEPMKILVLQMKDQGDLFNKGIIFQNVISTLIYLLIDFIMLSIFSMLFDSFNLQAYVISTWFIVAAGIFSTIYNLAWLNGKRFLSCLIVSSFIIFFFGAVIYDYTVTLPLLFGQLSSIPILLIIWGISILIAYYYGKYSYKTRQEILKKRI